MKFCTGLLVLLAPSVDGKSRMAKETKKKTFVAPHEIHQYEQAKFYDEPEWECRWESIGSTDAGGTASCMACRNPRDEEGEALIVEVKAIYKRADANIKDETVNKPRKHCIFPGWEFWVCMDNNMVIEPDTDWLGGIKDKPIYDVDGNIDAGELCYPGFMAAEMEGYNRFDGYTRRKLEVMH